MPRLITTNTLDFVVYYEGEDETAAAKVERRRLLGYKKLNLIHELAEGRHTQEQLAEKYEVTQSAISQFRQRNLATIQKIQENIQNKIDDRFAALWSAKKEARIAEYERIIEQFSVVEDPDTQNAKVVMTAIKSIAEETGQLTKNVEIGGAVTQYIIEGIDKDQLR